MSQARQASPNRRKVDRRLPGYVLDNLPGCSTSRFSLVRVPLPAKVGNRTGAEHVTHKGRRSKKTLREPVNGLTHAAGGVLAVVGLGVLLATAASTGRLDQLLAFGIFGLSLVALYAASALYHLLPLSPAGVARLRRLDHMTIFVLIAGTYTPFCVLALDGGWRWGLLALIWSLALCGVMLKLRWMDAPRWLSVALYLGMGWIAVIAASELLRAVPPGGIAWVLSGGLVYSAGALAYGLKRPNPVPGVFGFHEVWHIFVLAGSACHFWAVLHYIAPLA
jgi:hemolysin III